MYRLRTLKVEGQGGGAGRGAGRVRLHYINTTCREAAQKGSLEAEEIEGSGERRF